MTHTDKTAAALAKRFAEKVQATYTNEEMVEVIKLNAEETNPDVCHTHDFYDANELMLIAYLEVHCLPLDSDIDFSSVELADEWNLAWNIAKAANFEL